MSVIRMAWLPYTLLEGSIIVMHWSYWWSREKQVCFSHFGQRSTSHYVSVLHCCIIVCSPEDLEIHPIQLLVKEYLVLISQNLCLSEAFALIIFYKLLLCIELVTCICNILPDLKCGDHVGATVLHYATKKKQIQYPEVTIKSKWNELKCYFGTNYKPDKHTLLAKAI